MAHLISARARKATTDEISVSAQKVHAVRSEKGEQLTLFRCRNEPSGAIDLRMAIVVVRRFDSEFSMQRRYRAHDGEPLSAWTGKPPKARVEDVER